MEFERYFVIQTKYLTSVFCPSTTHFATIASADEHGDDMWWQVQKADGSSGVVPASYLVMDGGASFEVLHPGRGMSD